MLQNIIYFINIIRSFPVWMILKALGLITTICKDMNGYLYCIGGV